MTPKEEAAIALFESRMLEATGYTSEEYGKVRDVGPTSLAHVQLYGKLIDESGVVVLLEKWAAEARRSNAGRKPIIPFRAALVLHLMHSKKGNIRYHDIARTLHAQLPRTAFEYLGITTTIGDHDEWYMRFWKALNRILALLSPWDVPRNTFLSAEAYRRAHETYSKERRDRMDIIMNALAHASARRLPEAIRKTYKGNVALDATAVTLTGRPNPRIYNLDSPRYNLDAMSGPYTREGEHEGDGRRSDKPAWEVETVVTVPNTPGDIGSFPFLTTGITMHAPGKVKHGPLIAVRFHTKLFDERGFILVDRNYNNLKSHRFQNPTRMMGFRHVYNFKDKKREAVEGAIGDVIAVDGCLYVKWMPIDLINATYNFHHEDPEQRIDEATYREHLRSRTAYRLKNLGYPDAEGRQRFMFPDLSKVACFDTVVHDKPVRPKLAQRTFTLAPDSDEAMRIIKHLMHFEYRSPEWFKWAGQRSHVEANNQYLKREGGSDLGDPRRRRPRGYAFQALAIASATAVSNLSRIVTFLEAAVNRVISATDRRRARRRRDEHGNRLEHPTRV
ncbi:hypothetical protein Q9R20_06225 [Microbacterium sp. PRF11]|uniref:hypothetical protein n=1 Tax=Microbacterium sp. PRF11 TaxID=2962593 RepID=UPI0028812386|nr:hypothetical protein [Microbacterium sp. PRF11]MDT0116583.1 hypothetical protein [Microbacterium sp. PRF11]